ncbi:hypothetical protein [Acinetobacter cumulans]|uniref:hypothetical protein n=1 Tax=Acinetobacter cumulans TaxID=2136182 RepID=UPI00148D91EE|nr:hypothetical protein [Acinetobacter cumulans]
MNSQSKPEGATHYETDGTVWKNEKGLWMFWREGWGWCHFVGVVNKRLLDKFTPL